MKDQILDHFDDFEDLYDKDAKVVTVKYFYFEQEARLYAARLKEEGIKCFVSNANTITAFPLGEGGIGLHVKEEDKERASFLVKEMDKNKKRQIDEDFRDADLEDIEYQKALREGKDSNWAAIGIVLILIVLILIGVFAA